MEYELDNIIKNLDNYSSNLNGLDKNTDYLTLEKVYQMSKPMLLTIGNKYSLSHFSLPDVMGANSLVIFADILIDDKLHEVAIKIYVQPKCIKESIEHLQDLVSLHDISPKLYYKSSIEFGSIDNIITIVMNSKIIQFTLFNWTSPIQMKRAVVTLLEKTMKLHRLGFVHNDIKYENFGMDKHGTVFLYDFDNFDKVRNNSCSILLSSIVCHPPHQLRSDYINYGLGNRLVDLFSIISIILGDIFGIINWQFSREQFPKKNQAISTFNCRKIIYWIQYNLSKKFCGYVKNKSPFWYALTNFINLILLKSKITRHRTFFSRAQKLISRMKENIDT